MRPVLHFPNFGMTLILSPQMVLRSEAQSKLHIDLAHAGYDAGVLVPWLSL